MLVEAAAYDDDEEGFMNVTQAFERAFACVVFLLLPLSVNAASTQSELATARQNKEQAGAALESARESLRTVQASLEKNNKDLAEAYYILDDEVRRKDKEAEKQSRAAIKSMNEAKLDLWTERDRAKLFVAQREAELESAEALVKVHELKTAPTGDSGQIGQWQKRSERALARAQKLQRQIAEIPAEPKREGT